MRRFSIVMYSLCILMVLLFRLVHQEVNLSRMLFRVECNNQTTISHGEWTVGDDKYNSVSTSLLLLYTFFPSAIFTFRHSLQSVIFWRNFLFCKYLLAKNISLLFFTRSCHDPICAGAFTFIFLLSMLLMVCEQSCND